MLLMGMARRGAAGSGEAAGAGVLGSAPSVDAAGLPPQPAETMVASRAMDRSALRFMGRQDVPANHMRFQPGGCRSLRASVRSVRFKEKRGLSDADTILGLQEMGLPFPQDGPVHAGAVGAFRKVFDRETFARSSHDGVLPADVRIRGEGDGEAWAPPDDPLAVGRSSRFEGIRWSSFAPLHHDETRWPRPARSCGATPSKRRGIGGGISWRAPGRLHGLVVDQSWHILTVCLARSARATGTRSCR